MVNQSAKKIASTSFSGGQALELIKGDITLQDADAIVNAANSQLAHGGGVAWHISHKGGRTIQEESDAWVKKHGPVSHSLPAVTGAGSLPCRFVIHAVGPVWGEGDEDRKLEAAILGSIKQAVAYHLSSIAFPAISTGIFGFPKERAGIIFFRTIKYFYHSQPESQIKCIRIVLIDEPTLAAFTSAFRTVFSQEDFDDHFVP